MLGFLSPVLVDIPSLHSPCIARGLNETQFGGDANRIIETPGLVLPDPKAPSAQLHKTISTVPNTQTLDSMYY